MGDRISIQQTLHEIAKFHFILAEGRKGYHLLFSPDVIRVAFEKDSKDLQKLFQDKLEDINQALNHTFSLSSFEEKRTYIASLPEEIQHSMVFGYFQLLEGIDGGEKTIH